MFDKIVLVLVHESTAINYTRARATTSLHFQNSTRSLKVPFENGHVIQLGKQRLKEIPNKKKQKQKRHM